MIESNSTLDLPPSSSRSERDWGILFAMLYPTLLTLTYFLWLSSSSSTIQQIVYAFGKLIQFGFPILYVMSKFGFSKFDWLGHHEGAEAVESSRVVSSIFRDSAKNNFLWGTAFACSVVAAMFVFYFFFLPDPLVSRLTEKVQLRVASIGLGSPFRFLALSLFYVVGHSFLEEYYWRWFVFDQLRQKMALWKANLIAGFGFMAHHVVLLGTFFGWNSPLTYLLSLGVAVGGFVWAWLFGRQWGFRSAWFSHAIVDAGIFGLGMLILFANS